MALAHEFGEEEDPAVACPACQPAVTRLPRTPSVLVAASTRSGAARVAMAFAELGCHVEAICWFRGPLAHTGAVRRVHRYDPLRPLAALRRALARAQADLVVPCDDRAVSHLLVLHDQLVASGERAPAAVIARSLGDVTAVRAVTGRAAFAALARDAGLRMPLTVAVADVAQLRAAIGRVGLPAMLKVDGTWGGTGVARVDTLAEAERAFARLSGRVSALRTFKRLVVNRDPFWLLPWLRGERPVVNVQAFVPGRPANCVVSCREGEVLAIIQAEVLSTSHPTGPAAVVRIVEHAEMAAMARRIVARGRMSGFRGLDFVIEEATGALHLIEMNPRITPLGHLALDRGRDPVGAWVAGQAGRVGAPRTPITGAEVVAFFPQAWWLDPANPDLATAYHDVPWTEPDLVRELVRLSPWDQGWLARCIEGRRGGRPQTQAEAPRRPAAIRTLLPRAAADDA